ncbi:hypothetical protein [Tautonia rosea]|uniref:hypothetical protein n=1 Tax=Tautonia rosea TaxID=2728037 RepID=UPI0014758A43|nr:hypothetical protein [Tautonia rosea]
MPSRPDRPAPANPFEAPETPIRADRSQSRWRWPGPLGCFTFIWVGLAVGILATIDGNLGKEDSAIYGFPFPYRSVPRVMAPPGSPPAWFSPGILTVDLAIIAAMLGASVAVAQRLSDRLGLPPRFSIGSLCGLIAAVALILASLRFALILAWLILTAGLVFGVLSPFLWLALRIRDAGQRTEPPSISGETPIFRD